MPNKQQGNIESMLSTMRDMEQHRMGGFRVELQTLPRDTTWLNVMDALQLGCNWVCLVFPLCCIFCGRRRFDTSIAGKTI